MKLDRRDLGTQPRSKGLKRALISLVPKREPEEEIIIHHATDRIDVLQLEVERRSKVLGIAFERLFIR